MKFSTQLIHWFHQNKRELPWRNTRDPYKIWLSEIILQQTRVEQGLPYFNRYISAYPDLHSFALATEDEILKVWQGLGYYSRARNMHKTANYLVKHYEGRFPDNYQELMKLPGIGPYTAAAIASFAFNEPTAVVDGNVFRVLSRFLGISEPVNSHSARKIFTEAANSLLDPTRPADFNQAIMEFGAIWCKPVNPDCERCIFSDRCYAFRKKEVKSLPVKQPKAKQKPRYFNYLHLRERNQVFIQKRKGDDIWKGLYEFILIESEQNWQEEDLLHNPRFRYLTRNLDIRLSGCYIAPKHILSHQIIHARFWQIDILKGKLKANKAIQKIEETLISEYPVPRILDLYLKKINLVR